MTLDDTDLAPASGVVAPEVAAEFPGLRLDWVTTPGSRRPSPRAVVARLAALSNRARGASAVAMRTQPVPHAYRSFFRQIGLDPDVDRPPGEAASVRRLLHGGYESRDQVEDALLIAVVETGVPVWALDTDEIDAGGLGIRLAAPGEELAPGHPLPAGSLVVADPVRAHGLLFGPLAPGREVTGRTRRITLFSVGVEGVPAIHVEEALWVCLEALSPG